MFKCQTNRFLFVIGFLVFLLMVFGLEVKAQTNTDTDNPAGDVAQAVEFDQSSDLTDELLSMSLEELLDLDVTSVSKRKQKWFDSAAAIYVVTAEDIRRSGAQTLPDALRMVPGVNIAALFSHDADWTVGTRGFNRFYSNKLLVQIDGRSIYRPDFAGVYWSSYPLIPEDIDRIEVIRGPGASLWGANAVNGIINIVTKSARDTQGVKITGGGGKAGALCQSYDSIRYGGKLDEDTWYRIFGQYHFRDRYDMGDVRPAHAYSSGFRLDRQPTEQDLVTLQTDWTRTERDSSNSYYDRNTFAPVLKNSADITGLTGNVLARWNHKVEDGSEITTQFYYDRFEWRTPNIFETMIDTLDFDFQHSLRLNEQNHLVWGLGYRYYNDQIDWLDNTLLAHPDVHPSRAGYHLVSAFVHDEMELVQDKLKLTIGSKFEHNDFSGFEFQPNARLLYKPHEDHVLWAAVSRALRTLSRFDNGVEMNNLADGGGFAVIPHTTGSDDVESEELIAYELGYRIHPHEDVFVDVTTFYNNYDKLINVVTTDTEMVPGPPPYLRIDSTVMNSMEANSYGLEAVVNWQVADWWKLTGAYSYLHVQLSGENPNTAPSFDSSESAPRNQFNLRSSMNLPHGLEFDTMAYYVDNVGINDIPHYIRLDARLGWHISENLEFSIVGQNLADSWHPEYDHVQEIPCGFYSQLTLRF